MHHSYCRSFFSVALLLCFLLFTLPVYVFLGMFKPLYKSMFLCFLMYYLFFDSRVCMSVCLRAQSYAERLRLGLAVMHGEANPFESDMVDGPQSPPLSRPTVGHTGLELPCKTPNAVTCVLLFVFPLFLEPLIVIYGYLSWHY